MKLIRKILRDINEDMTRTLDVPNWNKGGLVLVRKKACGGKHKLQDRWKNVPYVVMEKNIPRLASV